MCRNYVFLHALSIGNIPDWNRDLPKSSLCFPVHKGVCIWLCIGQSQVKTLKMESASKKVYYGVGFVPPLGADS